jgi:imidazolonepropionase
VATDSNPGTAPTASLLLALNMACTLFRLTVPEALAGVTVHAARALGKSGEHGSLAIGRIADFAIWSVDTLAELCYWAGVNCCNGVVKNGVRVR